LTSTFPYTFKISEFSPTHTLSLLPPPPSLPPSLPPGELPVTFLDSKTLLCTPALRDKVAAVAFDPFPYSFPTSSSVSFSPSSSPLALIGQLLATRRATGLPPPSLTPSFLRVSFQLVQGEGGKEGGLRDMTQVAPKEGGVVCGLHLGHVMDALGKRAVPLDGWREGGKRGGGRRYVPLMGGEARVEDDLSMTISTEDLAAAGASAAGAAAGGGGALPSSVPPSLSSSLERMWTFTVTRSGQAEAVLYWVDALDEDHRLLVSSLPPSSSPSCHPPSTPSSNFSNFSASSASSSLPSSSLHCFPMIWVDFQPFPVQAGQSLTIHCRLGPALPPSLPPPSSSSRRRMSGEGGISWAWLDPSDVRFLVDYQGGAEGEGEGGREGGREGGIPSYHFPMLNDRVRNNVYAAAIKRAVTRTRAGRMGGGRPITVLDIGAGSGLLGMLAAREGGRERGEEVEVWCLEKEALLAGAAYLLAEDNGLSERVVVVNEASTDLEDATQLLEEEEVEEGEEGGREGRRFDVLVSEVFGDQPFSEGALQTFRHAQESMMEEGAIILPSRLRLWATLGWGGQEMERLGRFPSRGDFGEGGTEGGWLERDGEEEGTEGLMEEEEGGAAGLELSAWDCALEVPLCVNLETVLPPSLPRYLALEPVCIGEVDLDQRPLPLAGQLEGGSLVIKEGRREGGRKGGRREEEEEEGEEEQEEEEEEKEEGEGRRANALIVWFELVMFPEDEKEVEVEEGEGVGAGGLVLSTAPSGPRGMSSHWKQVVFYLPPSHPHTTSLKAGERVRIVGAYDRDRLRVQVVGKEEG